MHIITFKGGIQPVSRKNLTKDMPAKYIVPKGELVYPLSQNGIDFAFPVVVTGEYVQKGQKIAEASGNEMSIYSSVSGFVVAVEPRLNSLGKKVRSIVIENDQEYQEVNYQPGYSREYDRRLPKDTEQIEYVVMNGVGCEPYITSSYRRMIENPEDIVSGMDELLKRYMNAKGIFIIAEDKMDCVFRFIELIKDYPRMKVMVVKNKYPQEMEELIVSVIVGRKGKREKFIIETPETFLAIYREFIIGEPLTERIVTVSGDGIREPGNFNVLYGTSYRTLIEASGGLTDEVVKVISGGPLSGYTVSTLDVPVTRDTTAILCLKECDLENNKPKECIKCGRCVEVCPKGLIPMKLADFAEDADEKAFLQWNGMSCISCGCCSYKCPAKRQLKQSITAMQQNMRADSENGGTIHE